MFKRILIANRGEIAQRIITTCKRLGIETVAVYSEADRGADYLEVADLTVCVGAGPAVDSYMNQRALLQAAQQYDCQALHPGYGFLAENALFAARCEQQKTTFIGPRPKLLRLLGQKDLARAEMEKRGVPTVPGSDGAVPSLTRALSEARKLGYPVMLKAISGGGGRGMRVCNDDSDLRAHFDSARLEAEATFGDPEVYLERFVEGARHIEFQLLGDAYGNVIHLGERECTTQRHHQKLVEEAPSPGIDTDTRVSTGAALCKVFSSLGLAGLGTVEFLMNTSGELFFIEVNPRLQVEHPVTELGVSLDLVEWQLRTAMGQFLDLPQIPSPLRGHTIECRINAENPRANFAPSPGLITRFEVPREWRYELDGPVRLDTHVDEGYRVPTYYDSLLAKLIVRGRCRADAIELMRQSLERMHIEGVHTTLDLLKTIVHDPVFCSGQYSTLQMSRVIDEFASTPVGH